MDKFPNLSTWFTIDGYKDINACRTIRLSLKDNLSDSQINDFINEFAKLICRIRCSGKFKPFFNSDEDLNEKFQQAITGDVVLNNDEKDVLKNEIFFTGMISQKKFDETLDYSASKDYGAFNGYFGEMMFYLVRKQVLEDEKIAIIPEKPKNYSKEPGLDYCEIRKNQLNNEYYFIVGEVKTTINSISDYPKKIIHQLKSRSSHLYYENFMALKEKVREYNDNSLNVFAENIPKYYRSPKNNTAKRYAGVINYGKDNSNDYNQLKSFSEEAVTLLYDDCNCRRIKLIHVENMDDIQKKVFDCIWNKL